MTITLTGKITPGGVHGNEAPATSTPIGVHNSYRDAVASVGRFLAERRAAFPEHVIGINAIDALTKQSVTLVDIKLAAERRDLRGLVDAHLDGLSFGFDHFNSKADRTVTASCEVSIAGEVVAVDTPPRTMPTGDPRRRFVSFDAYARGDLDPWLAGEDDL